MTGRWQTTKLLATLQSAPDPLHSGSYICQGTPTYEGIKALICKAADISADPAKDRTASPCDALSIVVGYASLPAQFGPIVMQPIDGGGCPDAAPDDCNQ